jgi:hypothetical protein
MGTGRSATFEEAPIIGDNVLSQATAAQNCGWLPHTQKWLERWERWFDNYVNDPEFRPQKDSQFAGAAFAKKGRWPKIPLCNSASEDDLQ